VPIEVTRSVPHKKQEPGASVTDLLQLADTELSGMTSVFMGYRHCQ